MPTDTERLKYIMEGRCFSVFYSDVTLNFFEYSRKVAAENCRSEPNADDKLEGFRRTIDYAMAGLK